MGAMWKQIYRALSQSTIDTIILIYPTGAICQRDFPPQTSKIFRFRLVSIFRPVYDIKRKEISQHDTLLKRLRRLVRLEFVVPRDRHSVTPYPEQRCQIFAARVGCLVGWVPYGSNLGSNPSQMELVNLNI